MAKHARNPLADWLMQRGRTRFQGRIHMRNAGLKNYLRAADKTDSLFYLPDEDHGEKHSVFAPFYGVPKATLTTLARMARIADAKIIPAITLYSREEKRYVMTLLPPFDNFPSGNDLDDASRMNQALEALVDQSPEQYLWTMRLFRTRPENTPPVYD
jgi:lauroyl-KDO2-lipid IV(A) myristoyltransferase